MLCLYRHMYVHQYGFVFFHTYRIILYCLSTHFLHLTCKLFNINEYRSYDLIPWNTKLHILPSVYHCSVPWQTFILSWKGTSLSMTHLLWFVFVILIYLLLLPFNLKFCENREWFIYIYILVPSMGPCLRKFIQYLLHDHI